MHHPLSIIKVSDIFKGQRVDLPERAGVYAFWWIADKEELLSANRHIVLKGPKERPVNVQFNYWCPEELTYPCLYEYT